MLSEKKRRIISKRIKLSTKNWAIGVVSEKEIESLGMGVSCQLSFKRAIKNLSKKCSTDQKPDFVLVDGYKIKDLEIPCKGVIKGDTKCLSIAASSIIAKVYRDNLMRRLSKKYPKYGFEKHKGYGTKKHLEALKKYGPCEIHRKNFKPVKLELRIKRDE